MADVDLIEYELIRSLGLYVPGGTVFLCEVFISRHYHLGTALDRRGEDVSDLRVWEMKFLDERLVALDETIRQRLSHPFPRRPSSR